MNRPESKSAYRRLGGGRRVAKHRAEYKRLISRTNRRKSRQLLRMGQEPGPNVKLNKLDIS